MRTGSGRQRRGGWRWTLALLGLAVGEASSAVVTKRVESFDALTWQAGGYNRASGEVRLFEDGSAAGDSKTCLRLGIGYSGRGFEFFTAEPIEPLRIPGHARRLRLRVRRSDPAYGLTVTFRDGWNREKGERGDLKLDLPFRAAPGEWESVDLAIPAAWVKPVRITALASNNWGKDARRADVTFDLDELEVETDIAGVDPESGVLQGWTPDPNPGKDSPKTVSPTPLTSVVLSSGEPSNVFSREEPRLVATFRNWREAPLRGTLVLTVRDDEEGVVEGCGATRTFDVAASQSFAVPLAVPRFGRYHADVQLRFDDGAERKERLTFAKLPPWRELTDAQKDASPYGVNTHGGGTTQPVVPFRKAGLVWFRDYAFSHDTMRKANADRQWGGWPWYPKILRLYADNGVRVLPCSQNSIPRVPDGAAAPVSLEGDSVPREWMRDVAERLLAFPDLRYWELDNEYDLHGKSAEAETRANWARYRAYHKAFGKVVGIFGGESMKAVENGRAGVWPDRLKSCIESGDFADIGVVNVHHYTGTEPPEVNFGNMNTGFAEGHSQQAPALFFDRLRDVKRVAQLDGRPREAFLTEFGWDTLAGHVVTPQDQAAYLVRGYLLAFAAGIDKAFWFYHYDSATPRNFFDGCGLLGPVEQGAPPKRSLCTLAGLTWLLPNPKILGQVRVGDDTGGYVVEQDGQWVAVLFTIRGDQGPTVTLRAQQLYDAFANPLPGRSVTLTRQPVYAVGLDRDDPLCAQIAYELDSHHLVLATAGDEVAGALRVQNRRARALEGTVRLELPEGWTSIGNAESTVAVAPGGDTTLPFRFRVAAGEGLGERSVRLVASEGGRVVKELPLRVLVQEALSLQVGPITGRPGETTVAVKVLNRSSRPMDGTLRLRLPATWSAPSLEQAVAGLEPNVVRTLAVPFRWRADWAPGEQARVEFESSTAVTASRPLIPNAVRIPKAGTIVYDGDFADWPAAAVLPAWLLGSDLGVANAEVRLAWSEAGLHVGLRVADSKVVATDPRSFWDGDCVELFVDTADDKRDRGYEPGDHQFWFVPRVDEKRVYVGQWDRGTELAATQYDVRGGQSFAAASGDGYTLEMLLPAQSLVKYRPVAGGKLGLCINLTVHGKDYQRQVYWPWTKDWAVQNQPKSWGTVELGE